MALGAWGCDEPHVAGENVLTAVPSWHLEESLRIGRENHPDYALVPVGGLAVAEDERILVSQPQERAIRVFDREGRFLQRIGRAGDGPGEFLRLGQIGVLPGTIWALDCRELCFVQFFDDDGSWVDRIQTPRLQPPFIGGARYYPLPDGGMLMPSASVGDIIETAHELPWLRSDSGGRVVDTLPGVRGPGIVIIQNQITLPDGRRVDSPVGASHPFPARSWVGISPDQSSLVRAEVVQGPDPDAVVLLLVRFTPYGDTLATGEVSLPQHPIPAAVVEIPRLDLGGPRNDPNQELSSRGPFHNAIRLSDGRYVVPDLDDLKVFDPEGHHLFTLGRPGEGPGRGAGFRSRFSTCTRSDWATALRTTMSAPFRGATPLATIEETITGPFYHGTRADLKPGDLITPGYRSNYGHGKRTNAWVYLSAIVSPWAAELALGDGPGRIYIVERTGPFEDDPDLTDKRFAGNPTRSYRSRFPLRVVGEVTDWKGHSPEEIKAMKAALDRHRAEQASRINQIPDGSDFDQLHAQADVTARDWASDAEYCGCTLLMLIRGKDVEVFSAMKYFSEGRGDSRLFELPHAIDLEPSLREGDVSLSGRVTDVTTWKEGWAAVIESCITEIGLSLETRVWIAVDAMQDTLTFRVDADGSDRSWRRDLLLTSGVLTDMDHGEIWDFAAGSFGS